MKRIFILLLFVLTCSCMIQAQSTVQPNASEILLSLKKLNTVGSVLYIAAHPDDENTRLLAYLAKERNVRTGYLSLTRGDGGQNLIGKEQGEALGLIRTQELLAARRTDGAEQFFTRANDFGFSKNPEETFAIWNKDSILADVVWTIRQFKPDVIICRFPTTGEGGHGHHTASAILAVEAYDAAADPKRFPEQLRYVQPWQVKRVFWNTFNFGGINLTAPNQLKIEVGSYNTLLGKGYGEIASESRSMHKSQGFGSARTRGNSLEYFKLLKGDSTKIDLFDGVDQSWKRLAVNKKIAEKINDCIAKYSPLQPEKSVPDLIIIYKLLEQLNSTDATIRYWKELKLKETETLLLACSGLWMEAYSAEYTSVPGNDLTITSQIINRNKTDVKLNKISFLKQSDTVTALTMKTNELYSFIHKEKLSATVSSSNPYWLNEMHDAGRYSVKDPLLVGKPENEAPAKVVFDLTIYDLNLKIERGIVYKYTDPVKGEVYRPLEILPPATVNISDNVFVFGDAAPKNIQFTVKANASNVNGTLQIQLSDGWKIEIKNSEFKLVNKGDEILIEATLTAGSSERGILNASLLINNIAYTKSIKRIEYDHIPYQFILSDAEAELVKVNLKKTGTNIGYIPGPGDEVPACLKQVGYTITVLTDDLLTKENLSKYDAIVSGVRAYNTNNRLQVNYAKLMDYVQKGGNLIVQYNTNNRIGPLTAKIGPYPFTISRDRVTNEKAEVRFIKPEHTVLNYPNVIMNKDFESWVQERGIYFATELDKNYETIFSMNDPNEKISEGSLIITKYGKGNFVYTGLAFFRELPAGVPGAYRLFVNLISLPPSK
jgi:LmbE family N-acetylglucosaminyl deacetylase